MVKIQVPDELMLLSMLWSSGSSPGILRIASLTSSVRLMLDGGRGAFFYHGLVMVIVIDILPAFSGILLGVEDSDASMSYRRACDVLTPVFVAFQV